MNAAYPETRAYPACCRSASCGRIECTGCPNVSILADFKAWVAQHDAVVKDPIWCPSVYTARKQPLDGCNKVTRI